MNFQFLSDYHDWLRFHTKKMLVDENPTRYSSTNLAGMVEEKPPTVSPPHHPFHAGRHPQGSAVESRSTIGDRQSL